MVAKPRQTDRHARQRNCETPCRTKCTQVTSEVPRQSIEDRMSTIESPPGPLARWSHSGGDEVVQGHDCGGGRGVGARAQVAAQSNDVCDLSRHLVHLAANGRAEAIALLTAAATSVTTASCDARGGGSIAREGNGQAWIQLIHVSDSVSALRVCSEDVAQVSQDGHTQRWRH